MGIQVQHLLNLEYFQDFHVLAGRNGLQREVQGIVTVDTPDAFQWMTGKELVLATGYVFQNEPQCLRDAFRDGNITNCAAMMIQRGHYLNNLPDDTVQKFEELGIPLISMPYYVSFQDVTSQITMAVIDRSFRDFGVVDSINEPEDSESYKQRKAVNILKGVEKETHFPTMLYDIRSDQAYFSSDNFQKEVSTFGLEIPDFWKPALPFTRHLICDYMNMERFRIINEDMGKKPRFSWITTPITVNGITEAYLVLVESRDFIDHYDELSLRTAYLILQQLYENIYVGQNVGSAGFENFIRTLLEGNSADRDQLVYQANTQGVSLNDDYICVYFKQTNHDVCARNARPVFLDALRSSAMHRSARLAFLGENEGVILLSSEGCSLPNDPTGRVDQKALESGIMHFQDIVLEHLPDAALCYSTVREKHPLSELKDNIQKCLDVLHMGKIIFPEKNIWDYDELGPLAWIRIPEKDLEEMEAHYRELSKDEKNEETLHTLKVYLENNMNFSLTAKKLDVHINTVRSRIARAEELVHIDWDDYVSRIKTQLLLQFLHI
ncbi:MAG: PucR family transcriptional regulator [Eubacterium sp.]|jgi:purine catabolism regulator|nr:PucR family transcriptional regulator [Eubacterium sp.]MCH4045990.1 PucR family transcriptional regulator [Eubacterium sp.]MCH4079084.1 PucR family transcriptional regulator [Eubacterium sp.]MCH4110789.1 PucR family transcriptional regulator [Eubacterium sp.]MCI1306931.1 PucR family transcriptional regulator [Eubacterium sp.]